MDKKYKWGMEPERIIKFIEIFIEDTGNKNHYKPMIVPLNMIETVTKDELFLYGRSYPYMLKDGEYAKLKNALIPPTFKFNPGELKQLDEDRFKKEYLGEWVGDDKSTLDRNIQRLLDLYMPRPVHHEQDTQGKYRDFRLGDWLFFKDNESYDDVMKLNNKPTITGIDGHGPYIINDIFYDVNSVNVGFQGVTHGKDKKGIIHFNTDGFIINTTHPNIKIRPHDKICLRYEAFEYLEKHEEFKPILDVLMKDRKPIILEVFPQALKRNHILINGSMVPMYMFMRYKLNKESGGDLC